MFSSSNSSGSLVFLESLARRVTSQMNEQLTRGYSAEEVKVALQQMNLSTAPGLDGMSPDIFQNYWHVVGDSVTLVVLCALNSGSFPVSFNHTFISLIPKKKKNSY